MLKNSCLYACYCAKILISSILSLVSFSIALHCIRMGSRICDSLPFVRLQWTAAIRVCWLSVAVSFTFCALPWAVIIFALQEAGCTLPSAIGYTFSVALVGKWWRGVDETAIKVVRGLWHSLTSCVLVGAVHGFCWKLVFTIWNGCDV